MADILPGFLSASEVAALRALAATPDGWVAGRQHSGYDILSLSTGSPARAAADPLVDALARRALAELGTPFEHYWDIYLIRYQDGAHIPPHVDEAQHGKRHRRINAVLTSATRGGELRIDGRTIDLATGDAVRFFSDREVHEVSRVEGSRLLFSVGAWIEPPPGS
ncbi:MAG TPA: 2OG-Fe(II) oxygenase [Kofleriaceae bacterium]|nr:2OG-Fe(II) oxygenase [Kofleriaceae bacterium]